MLKATPKKLKLYVRMAKLSNIEKIEKNVKILFGLFYVNLNYEFEMIPKLSFFNLC